MAQDDEGSESQSRERGASPPVPPIAPAGGDLLTVERPAAGTAKVIDPAGFKAVKFTFGLDDARVIILDVDVVLVFPDGGRLILPAFMMQMITAEPPRLSFAEQAVDPQAVIAAAGDVRLADPLPQLAVSDEARPSEKPPEAPSAPPVVQMPASQAFANTPAPSRRPSPSTPGDGEGDALQEGNARFARRINHDEIQGSSLKSEGSLTASTEKVATASKQDADQAEKSVTKDTASEAPENANAPVITSFGAAGQVTLSMGENRSSVATITATDQETPTSLTYSVAGGADADKFAINSKTGQLYFVDSPNHEAPGSAQGSNSYNVVVEVSDGSRTDQQQLTVNVGNVNEAPSAATLSAATVSENAANGTVVGLVTASDPDAGGSLTYSFASGGDAGGRFVINAATGAITVNQGNLIDHETSAQHVVVVRVTDQDGLSYEKPFVINVTDANDAPVITSNGGGASATTSVNENSSLVTTATAADPDAGDVVTYTIIGGQDAALFTIDPVTGALSFVTAPNFEAPADADGNNIYEVTIRASDGSLSDTQSISITVNDSNDPPVITSNGGGPAIALTTAENSTATITTMTATDVDAGANITFSIIGGADAGKFTINPLTGELRFVNPTQNFEAPDDAGGNGVYDVVVQALDGQGGSDTQSIAVTLTDANDAPTITSDGGGATASLPFFEGAVTVTTVTATDPDAGASVGFSITGGTDAARFTINPTTGVLSFVTPPDFEAPTDSNGDNVYQVIVTADDGAGGLDSQTINVIVDDQNDPPSITSNGGGANASVSATENSVAATTVTASDPDAGSTLTYSITGGADAARFTIDSATGVLTFVSAPNFEAPTDAGANNVYDVIVQVSDGAFTDSQSIAVTVTNQNEAPSITSNGGGTTGAVTMAENVAGVTTVTGADPDAAATLTYSIIGGVDAARFTINPATGALTFVTPADFENPADAGADNVYDVTVQVSDGLGGTDTQSLAITITNANDPPVITSNGGGASAAVTVSENSTAITTVAATDADLNTVTYSISGGADAGRFTINPTTGALSFVSAPDFEAPTDAGANNVYDVIVQASDGTGGTDTQAIAVTVTNQNDTPPAITSNGGGTNAAISMGENVAAVTTVVANDPDPGASLTYSIIGGADSARFTINAVTGALTFVSTPDFETPADAGANNVYDVIVQVSDGTYTDSQTIAVTITNQNEAPAITSNGGGTTAAVSIAENTTAVATVAATDQDAGSTQSYSIVGGVDAAHFTINSSTGVLTFASAPNFESPTDSGANNVYDVTVRVSDGLGGTDDQAIAVTVTNQNEAPSITSNGGGANAAISIAENGVAVTTVAASDPDAGASLTYTITGGADAGRFTINAATGALTFVSTPNFEAPADVGANNVYDVVVQVSDGTFTDSQTIAVTVTNQNEAPAITSNGGGTTAAVSIAENTTAVTTVTATDQDAGATQSYSIVGGVDSGHFTINSSTGALTFVSAPNFESPTDSGGNNVYDVTVRVSDGLGGTDDQAVAVTVTNQNEAPSITSNGGGTTSSISMTENSTAVTTVTAVDPDAGASLSYAIIGGADSARFTINAVNGALSFVSAPNFEAPTDAGADNVYDVTVRVSDGLGGTDDQTVSVTVTNLNETPVITSNGGGALASVSTSENTTAVTTVTATDPDAGTTFTYSLVAGPGSNDNARFTIDSNTGVISFIAPPDFETPTDADANNVYLARVRVSDGVGGTDDQQIAVTVTGVNDNPPVITSNGGGVSAALALNENSTAVTTVTSTDSDAGASRTFSISGGADAARFTINATTGVLTFVSGPDFENPTDAGGDNVYDVQVQVSDGTFTDTQDIAVTINNVSGTQTGDNSDNTLIGTSEEDTISGLDGNDIIVGADGHDTLYGGNGNDTLSGDGGNDVIWGGGSDDNIYGGTGNNTLHGEAGDDRLYGDTSSQVTIDGGSGADLIYVAGSTLAGGLASVNGGSEFDTLYLSGTSSLTTAQLTANVRSVESIDFTQAGVAANLTNFTAADATTILDFSGPGNQLNLYLNANDSFSVAAGEYFTQAGNLYTFYSDVGLTNEIARVNII
jgi:hypothetical protein